MKYSLLTLAVAASMQSQPLYAQDTTDEREEKTVEVIQVTGSNIRGVDLEGSQPVTVITSEDIARMGVATISDLMDRVNQARGGVGSFDSTQSGATSTSTPPGQAAAALRGLGPSATLTLVNGRRVAASSFASGTENFVDINSIPASAVERVDILATGASAIYGADAVAGVINYILKDSVEESTLSVSYENTTDNDNHGQFNVQGTFGGEVAGGNLVAFFDYFDREAIKATDFAATRSPVLTSSYSYLPKNTPNIYYFSARDGNEIGAPNCATPLVETEFGEMICAYYGNEDDYFEAPLESLSGGLTFTKEIDDLFWRTDLMVTRTESTSFSTPAPINQLDDSEGPFVDETALDVFSPEIRDALLDNLYIDPFDTLLGRELFGFQYDARFGTPRTVEIESTSVRLVSVLNGTVGAWDWESGITLSRSESEQVAVAGIYDRYRYTAAISGELCANGQIANLNNNGMPECSGSQLLPMYNPFLQNDPNNDATLALTQARPTRDGESTLYGWDIKFTGELMEFGDDFIRIATGAEVRREEITDIPSLDSRARFENEYLVDVFGYGSSLSEASRTQWGVFAELYVPLTETLEMQLAGRFDDYNDFGSTFNPKVGLTFRPIDELVLRASWSTAFRAPSLTQAGVQLRTTRASFDCGANQTVADLYCEGDSRVVGNNVLELGNPALKPEESESYSIGLAYSPTKNTTITLDYWAFEHEDLVDTNMTDVLARATTDASLRHCGLVPVGEQGISYDPDLCLVTDNSGRTIEEDGANLFEILDAWDAFDQPRFIELPLFRDHVIALDNTGSQELEGIDIDLRHVVEFGAGELEFGFNGTHYLTYDRNIIGSETIESIAGTFSYPETFATAEVFWVAESWDIGLYLDYTGQYEDDIEGLRGREFDEVDALGLLDENGARDVSSWTTVTLSAGYYWENLEMRLTVDNLFDRDAPLAFGSSRGFDGYNHDPYGTQYRLAVSYYFD
ncbi:TonB-dependent receptor [Alteromonas sediminis]|uniref:TonB-dependent receptor n=1 Tax=Alteromonas sediminis TaxID=2259342 RepID=A0A3N5Z9H4_9ALTE|nr:TonB-dependent receptor [Alteromonas sediminis]RPJ65898.1 TonB-dependent receptor [Alteromonas sediminis]